MNSNTAEEHIALDEPIERWRVVLFGFLPGGSLGVLFGWVMSGDAFSCMYWGAAGAFFVGGLLCGKHPTTS